MSNKELYIRSSSAEFLIFKLQEKEDGIQVRYENENLWMTQKAMAELFDVAENNITYHLQNIFNSGELEKNSVTQKIRVTASDGKNYNTNFYNLDAVISVGYRVNSLRATQFRRWATEILKKFAIRVLSKNNRHICN